VKGTFLKLKISSWMERIPALDCVGNGWARYRHVGIAGILIGAGWLAAGVATEAQIAVPKYQGPGQAPVQQHVDLPRPQATTPDGTVVEFPIARVNDQIIDNSDYQRALEQLNEDGPQAGLSQADLDQRRKDLLRDLIDTQLLLSRGKELDINADSEVIRQLDEIRKEHHFDSMEALEKAVRASGISFEDFKAKIKNDIITQQVIRDEVARKLTLNQKDEQAYYDAHKQEFSQPEQVRLSEILVPTPDNATDAQVSQAQAKADDIEAKLKGGAKFEDLAKQYSGGPNADTGGDLGAFKRGELGSALLEDPAFALQEGQWTAPIRTRQGFLILEVTKHQQAGVPPLNAVEQQVQQALYDQAMRPALRTYMTSLREKAFIDIAAGYTDTGASSKETKPVFAAASQPTVKKKVEQKARLERQRAAYAAQKAQAKADANKAAVTANAGGVNVASGKKPKKIHREKIRFGQMPQNSLPETPQETLATGEGPGAPASGEAAAEDAAKTAADESNVAANDEPIGPPPPAPKKTRFADREAEMAGAKAQQKATKLKQRTQMVAPALTSEDKVAQQTQGAALGLNGDTAAKKKKKKVKGEPKERMQQAAPAPPAPKPDATPIPSRSVRQNGEPEVAPPANSSPATTPSSGTSAPAATPQQ
jgi:peptidyl-prolyl cis-trans isomerase SurA